MYFLVAIAGIAIILFAFFFGLPRVQAYGNVTDLPFLGGHRVTCDMPWHEDCLNKVKGYGIDFGMSRGEVIYAAGPGTVYAAGWANGWGYQVVVRHIYGGETYYTRYAHLLYYFPPVGGRVGPGSPIGYADSTGNSSGDHLHFEMYRGGLSATNSIPFTPIYGLRDSGRQYHYGDVVYWAVLDHDRYPGTTVTVDDKDADFFTIGWWGSASYGFDRGGLYNARTRWTYSNGSVVDSRAYWEPDLSQVAYYAVYVFIPNNYATSRNAHYRITNGYSTWHRYVDQYIYYNDWVYLGTYPAVNGYLNVRLDDASGEPAGQTYIAADAMMFVP